MMRYFFVKTFLVMVLACTCSVVSAEIQTFEYRTRNPRARAEASRYTLTVDKSGDGRAKYARIFTGDDIDKYEDFILDANFETVEWSTQRQDQDTQYSGHKAGRKITLKGTLKGQPIDKSFELEDDKPFYFSPKFNLQQLILSDQQEVEFWTLRKDELTPYLMVAEKDGAATLKIDGREVETVKVKYSPAGKFAKYYRRTYYYRASDGFFVYRKSPTGSITQLMSSK
ncbi:MAG: hypothetical protein K8I00_09485 [Candidatus Omnitrophica bacterium]|nr:hypothetical protein [Candidatus Omnitrophota bacterium]